nr:chloride channel protein [Brucepastera parasyntrophica]
MKNPDFGISLLLAAICGKLLFTAVSYGSGAPGGIFFPLLILGALTGKLYYEILLQLFTLPPDFAVLFIILGMTSFFSGVTAAPITGCILISEMTGSLAHLIPLIIVSLTSYACAKFCGARPVYEQLLGRMMEKRNAAVQDGTQMK